MGSNRIDGIGNAGTFQEIGFDIVKRQEEASEVMFADMISMNSTVEVENFSADVSDEMLSTVKTEPLDTGKEKPSDAYEKYQYKDKTIRSKAGDDTQNVEKAAEEIEEFEEAVTEVFAEELHVSKEELEAAMEELGLTYLDLLDNNNLAALAAELTGCEQISQLLNNEGFMNILQEMKLLGGELLNDLQMTPEEFVEFQKIYEGLTTTDKMKESEKVSVTPENESQIDTVPEDKPQIDVVQEDEIQMNEVQEVPDEAENSMTDGEEQGFSDSDNQKSDTVQVSQTNEHVMVNDTSQTAAFAEQLSEYDAVQTLPPQVTVADIMEQFAGQTRVLLSADTTKLEMQLNPEHLGKLYIEIVESDGVITAKLQTQNADVKEALEMQIADLKVNLNQAGVKVDSVEVTIASHEFERNLEQDANSKKQQEETQAKNVRQRNINLNELDGLSGLMSEEEALVAKMMAEQGNSVDFTA